MNKRSHTPWPSLRPRISNLVCGRQAGLGANPCAVFASSGSAVKRREHLLRVVLPVGGRVQVAAGCEPLRERVHERGLQQPPLVMALLRPRVRKEDVDAGERRRRNHVRDDLDRVVPDDAHVGQRQRIDLLQAARRRPARARRLPGSRAADALARSPPWFRPCRSRSRA